MSTLHLIETSWSGNRAVLGSDGEWIFTQSVHGFASGSPVLSEATIDNTILLKGKFEAPAQDAVGISASGIRTEITIGKTGIIDAYRGVDLEGTDQTLVNNGMIVGGNNSVVANGANVTIINNGNMQSDEGVVMQSYEGRFINNGYLFGYDALHVDGTNSTVIVNETGVVSGERFGISSPTHNGELSIVNKGTVSGGTASIQTGDVDAHIVNRGKLIGDVIASGGDDMFDFRGGKLIGSIYGEDGDDTYVLSSTKTAISEHADDGYDTIKSTTSYNLSIGPNAMQEIEELKLIGDKDIDATGNNAFNRLVGNRGDNVLTALGGTDILDGGKGDDVLSGGSETDYFIFRTGGGHDVVIDFITYLDQFDFTGWKAIDDFHDMMKHHVSVEQGDVVISAGQDSIRLEGVSKGDLESVDFSF